LLKQRIITAAVLILLVLAIVLFTPLYGFALACACLCLLANWEWSHLVGGLNRGRRIAWQVGVGMVLLLTLLALPLETAVAIQPVSGLLLAMLYAGLIWWFCALLLVLSYPGGAVSLRQHWLGKTLACILTMIPFFWALVWLRGHSGGAGDWGLGWLLYVLLLVWFADSGAFFAGKRFGRHKLAPAVSPGKTWEGFIGGLAASLLVVVTAGLWLQLEAGQFFSLLLCSLLTVCASVVGDLTESMFKREVGRKDSSQLLPGHGGILDRIDSLTAALPVFVVSYLIGF